MLDNHIGIQKANAFLVVNVILYLLEVMW